MAVNDFSNQNIQDTYQRVVQTDGTNLADGTGSLLPISFEGNDVIVPGALKAQSYIVSESVVSVSSGSTIFGNSLDDVHQITGSLSITGSELRIKRSLANNNEAIIVENHVGPLITIGGTSMVNAPKIVGSQGALYIQNSDGVHI